MYVLKEYYARLVYVLKYMIVVNCYNDVRRIRRSGRSAGAPGEMSRNRGVQSGPIK